LAAEPCVTAGVLIDPRLARGISGWDFLALFPQKREFRLLLGYAL
jgi:hypothetical protein